MNKLFKLLLVVIVILSLGGCLDFGLYESKVPLTSSENAQIDARLLGQWVGLESEPREVNGSSAENKHDDQSELQHIRLVRFNQREYVLTSDDKEGCKVLRAYITAIGEVTFINIQELDEERTFLFCRYSFSDDDILTLEFVAKGLFEKIDEMTDSDALYEFFKKNLDNPQFYSKEMVLRFRRQ